MLTVVFAFNPSMLQAWTLPDWLMPSVTVEDWAEDTPGDGFESGDDCGFVMGDSNDERFGNGKVLLDYVDDVEQGCVGANGYFYEDSIRSSNAYHSTLGYMDFAWSSDSSNHVRVDTTTGYWSGYAKLTAAGLTTEEKWVWFDWDCPDGYTEARCRSMRVRTDTSTGEISGFAWSDYLETTSGEGLMAFKELEMELAPKSVEVEVDVLSDDGLVPDEVTRETAPLHDGHEYWRVRVRFYDRVADQYLDESYVKNLGIKVEETSDSKIYMDQVINKEDAVKETTYNGPAGCSDGQDYCVMTEKDGSTSFNMFVYSGAPTSNMLKMDINYVDRDGCKYIYDNPWPTGTTCGGSTFTKDDVYFARETDRNQYVIEEVLLDIELDDAYKDAELDLSLSEDSVPGQTPTYVYEFDGGEELSYRPRYQVEKFVAVYDGAEYTTISEDKAKEMNLVTQATVYDYSDEYKAAYGSTTANLNVIYWLDADSEPLDPMDSDLYLLADADDDTGLDSYNWIDRTSGTPAGGYGENYDMGYGQLDCDGCGSPNNALSEPTAEQAVCDFMTGGHNLEFGSYACYYTAYLPLLDRHDDPEEMLVIGAINSTIDAGDFSGETLFEAYADEEDYSILGAIDVSDLRDKLYEQVVRLTYGQEGMTGGTLDISDVGSLSTIASLMDDTLFYAEGDVYVTGGGGSFEDATLVTLGGDVYIEDDITGGKLGIISLEYGGDGGHVYLGHEVTDVYANIYADGSLFSKASSYNSEGVPQWSSEDVRIEALLNQIYLKGSLMSRNTAGGSDDPSYPDGSGGTTTETLAVEYDLNKLRQFRGCKELDGSGVPIEGTWELCEEGEELSTYGLDNGIYSSLVIEYDPPSGDMPIFTTESGLFN